MEEAEVLCDRIAIMDHAKIVALDTPNNLLKLADQGTTVICHVDKHVVLDELKKLPGVREATQEDHAFTLNTQQPDVMLPALFAYTKEHDVHLHDVQMHQATLEDVFLKLTGHSLRE